MFSTRVNLHSSAPCLQATPSSCSVGLWYTVSGSVHQGAHATNGETNKGGGWRCSVPADEREGKVDLVESLLHDGENEVAEAVLYRRQGVSR